MEYRHTSTRVSAINKCQGACVYRTLKSQDPRLYQIITLSLLLIYGLGILQFPLPLWQIPVLLGSAVLTQWLCTRLWCLPSFDSRSALISALSLCLLLRTEVVLLAMLAAVITISSKFLLRWRERHVFNPTNLGLVVMLLLTDGQVWVSPGQWGRWVFFSFLLVCLGSWVVWRAARSDVALIFLGSYAALLLGRALWLGDPLTIPLHQLQNGALILFAFFMISDPKTTPDSQTGRWIFAIAVALLAFWIQFNLYKSNALLWALAFCAPLVPLLNDWHKQVMETNRS